MDKSISEFYAELRCGDDSAARHLWQRFFPRLINFARRVYHNRPDRVTEAEDAAASAFVEFCIAVRNEVLDEDYDRHRLWRVLRQFTRRKIARQLERENSIKRGSQWSRQAIDIEAIDINQVRRVTQRTFLENLDIDCEELIGKLPEQELQEIVTAKILGFTNSEIASQCNCSTRRIERKLHLVRKIWDEILENT